MRRSKPRVLIGCERLGRSRDAFRRRGFDAWSCDLEPDVKRSRYHIQGDVLDVLDDDWDLAIFHPDCTFLTASAEWAFRSDGFLSDVLQKQTRPGVLVGKDRWKARRQDLRFVRALLNAPIPRIALENPKGFLSRVIGKPSQIIQPYQFGDDASKETHLWLKRLPLLKPTKLIAPRMINGRPRWSNQTDSGQNRLPPSEDRAILRAGTYPGIAEAFADQWGRLLI
jgi:hypothetical protein